MVMGVGLDPELTKWSVHSGLAIVLTRKGYKEHHWLVVPPINHFGYLHSHHCFFNAFFLLHYPQLLGSAILPPSRVPERNLRTLYVVRTYSSFVSDQFPPRFRTYLSVPYITLFHLLHFRSPVD